jgi:hypothetical protein
VALTDRHLHNLCTGLEQLRFSNCKVANFCGVKIFRAVGAGAASVLSVSDKKMKLARWHCKLDYGFAFIWFWKFILGAEGLCVQALYT